MKAFMNWSGGKDSSLALYHILNNKNFSVEKLLTTVNNKYKRISMHGVREELLQQQAAALQIPLQKIILDDQPSMNDYEMQMTEVLKQLKDEKFTHSIFGDIFLEDLKTYRESQLAKLKLSAVFPLWKKDTTKLIREFIDLGFKTIIVCVNEKYLDKSFCGRIIDEKFLEDLPPNVDACGENGEFHTFVFDGPIFKSPIEFTKGEIIYKQYQSPTNSNKECFTTPLPVTGFYFIDLLPCNEGQ
jgi:uncharacterized protein (TIGR00290 family)